MVVLGLRCSGFSLVVVGGGYSPLTVSGLLIVVASLVVALFLQSVILSKGTPLVALLVKNPPVNAGDIRVVGSVSGLGRSPRGGNGTHSSILVWSIP